MTMMARKNLWGWFLLFWCLRHVVVHGSRGGDHPRRHWLGRLRAGSSTLKKQPRRRRRPQQQQSPTKLHGGATTTTTARAPISWFSTNGGTSSSVGSTNNNNSSSTNNNNSWLDAMGLLWHTDNDVDDNDDPLLAGIITPQSDLSRPGRSFHIVTTASLPWFTGTAVNPLLRAAHLYQRSMQQQQQQQESLQPVAASISVDDSNNPSPKDATTTTTSTTTTTITATVKPAVTLVVPWLEERDDQERLYGRVFRDCQEQEDCIRHFLRYNANMIAASNGLQIRWYPARYHAGLGSIFAMGDILECCKGDTLDVCILEEPEHCNWYRAPSDSWTQRFDYVVGIVHTNYKEYAASHYTGLWTAPAIAWLSSIMVRAYCHKVIKLSDTLQAFAPEKEITSNVHGVRDNFVNAPAPTSNTIYFVGKLLWAKGLDLLLELEDYYKEWTGDYFDIEIYGTGPDQAAIQRAFHGRRNIKMMMNSINSNNGTVTAAAQLLPRTFAEFRQQPIPANFRGRVDHGDLVAPKIFVNPSISEVLCTTTAEALAMGKFVIIPYHPSNHFFMQFPNCLPYRDKTEFVANLRWALKENPQPLTIEQRRMFTWEAATDRLIAAAATTHRAAAVQERWRNFDDRIAKFHNSIGQGVTGDLLRKILGGGPVSAQVQYSLQAQQQKTSTVSSSSSTTATTTTATTTASLNDTPSRR